MLKHIHVAGYRSVRDLVLPLQPINVLTGPNGCGKSNLYNSLLLVARAAQGQLARAIADEGGTPSVFWAGGEGKRLQKKRPPKRVILGFEAEDYGYELQLGLPSPNEENLGHWREIKGSQPVEEDDDSDEFPQGPQYLKKNTMFGLDPRVKEEYIWPIDERGTRLGRTDRPRALMLKRDEPTAWLRNAEGRMVTYPLQIMKSESVLAQIIDPHLYPEISSVRQQVLNWRFYHHFRTDTDSPLRQPQIGVQTPVLNHDGSDLVAALQTILEVGDDEALDATVADAFGGAELTIESTTEAVFSLYLQVPGLKRPLTARELSDGQLRFLCLCAALLSPRMPSLLALNEPETSLHPDLIDALAKLIVRASKNTQLWITTHSRALAERIEEHSGIPRVQLKMSNGETLLA